MKKYTRIIALFLLIVAGYAGYRMFQRYEAEKAQEEQQAAAAKVPVKAMKVVQRDTTLASEFAGQVQSVHEVAVQSRVSGNVVEKMVNGGDWVKKGQSMFRIDTRLYKSAVLNAQADLAQAEAAYANSKRDTERYKRLLEVDAIAEQQVTTQVSQEKSDAAVVAARRAQLKQAQDDLDDTLIASPIDGRLNMDDVSIGTYATAGNTVLVTVGSIDPMYVQFSMSENDYLSVVNHYMKNTQEAEAVWGRGLTLTLSDRSFYPEAAEVTAVDRGLANNSGTLTIKAKVPNPRGILLPDMFVRVRADAPEVKDAILIPQRAVQQILDKSFVTLVVSEDRPATRAVTLGRKVGSFWLVEEGVTSADVVVVEGLTKAQEGVELVVTMVTPEDLNLTFDQGSTE